MIHNSRIWDLQTGACRHVLPGHKDSVVSAAFSGDGTRIVTCSFDGTARVWDAATGECVCELVHEGEDTSAASPTRAEVSSDGLAVVTLADDGARLWHVDEAGAAKLVAKLGEETAAAGAAMSPDGTKAAVCSQDGRVAVYETRGGKVVDVFCADAPCRCCTFSGGDDGVLAVGTEPGQVHFLGRV